MTVSRNLADLHPVLRTLADIFLEDCKKEGLDILVTCTYRSNDEQDKLYSEGKTRARGGQSEHNQKPALAFDIVPLTDKGKADWDCNSYNWKKIREIWERQSPIKGYYLDWYGRKGAPFLEYAHFCLKKF